MKYKNVSCSQCGNNFGPGNEGFSHCDDHAQLTSHFQFATRTEIFVDTGLITQADAEELWQKHKPEFIKLHEAGSDPEMVIWINCRYYGNYRETYNHVDHESTIIDGSIYNLVLIG